MPPRMLKRCFPPMVTGLTIFLIGAGLIGSGLKVGSALPTPLVQLFQHSLISTPIC